MIVRKMAALMTFLVVLTGCTLGTPEPVQQGGLFNDNNGTLTPHTDRADAPELCGTTLDGEELCLDQYRGQVVVVNFWASWCAPCRQEVPDLIAVAEDRDDVVIIGVNSQDSEANARSFERDHNVSFPSLNDETGQLAAAFGGNAPPGLPSTILIDRDHRVALTLLGAVTYPTLNQYLDELAGE